MQMQKISDIRHELKSIPEALRDEPEGVGHKMGDDPATLLYDPEQTAEGYEDSVAPVRVEDLIDTSGTGEGRDTPPRDPGPIFELPPEIEEKDADELLSDEDGDQIQQEVLLHGVEALGWYYTFHQMGKQWGIYVSIRGILYMVARVFQHLGCDNTRKLALAFHAIHRHELFHFAADYMSSQWELAVGDPCYWPARTLKDPGLGYNLDEEMLANAYMLRGFGYPSESTRERGAYSRLQTFATLQPPGYCLGNKVVPRRNFDAGCIDLSLAYQSEAC